MVKKAMMASAPKEYKKYRSCMKSKCNSERKAVKKNSRKLEKGMKRCLLSKKTNSGRKKCFKQLKKSMPSLVKLNKCIKKNCKSEKNKLTKRIKKNSHTTRKSLMKSMKKHHKSRSHSRKSKSHGRVKYYSK
jgi:hypothetical protein